VGEDLVKKYYSFLVAWIQKFTEELARPFNFLGIILGVLGFYGINNSSIPFSNFFGLAFIPFIVYCLYKSFPNFGVSPSAVIGKRLKIAELDNLNETVIRVGLLGRSSVGKTTFLNSTVNRSEPKRKTLFPYATIVRIEHSGIEKYIAFVDSVGESTASQAKILSLADLHCLFIDHNASDKNKRYLLKRLHSHVTLATDLAKARPAPASEKAIILIANKSDLWDSSDVSVEKMRETVARCREELLNGNGIKLVGRFSQMRK